MTKYIVVCLLLLLSAGCSETAEPQNLLAIDIETPETPNFEYVFEDFEEEGPVKESCSQAKIDEVWAKAEKEGHRVLIDCNLSLEFRPGEEITKRLVLEGDDASGVRIDCNDNTINGGDEEGDYNYQKDMIEVKSEFKEAAATFKRPENIRIQNCNIIGSVRLWGTAKNGQGTELGDDKRNYYKEQSYTREHTRWARENAPTNITLDNLEITGVGRNPVYFGPGVTNSRLINSDLMGWSEAVGLYLDAESSGNIIRSNSFQVRTHSGFLERFDEPQMAIDGSSHNQIINNRFARLGFGGIYLYRNCGEGGVVRHETPSHNQIINNVFYYKVYEGDHPAIYIGANDYSAFPELNCILDYDAPFGSGASNKDHATYNVVMQNQIVKRSVSDMIKTQNKDVNSPNFVNYNVSVTEDEVVYFGFAGCYVSDGYKDFIEHDETIEIFRDENGDLTCGDFRYRCNDGRLVRQLNPDCEFSERSFDCLVSGDNSGCQKFVYCAGNGENVLTAKAACNLEYGQVSDADLDSTPGGFIRIVKESDYVQSGACFVNGFTAKKQGEVQIFGIDGPPGAVIGCYENDGNGGDCHIKGTLYCR